MASLMDLITLRMMKETYTQKSTRFTGTIAVRLTLEAQLVQADMLT